MKTYALRLLSGQDLKQELVKFTNDNKLGAGFILTCVGSLKKAQLRMAEEETKKFEDKFEITSLVGTLCEDGLHLHISISDNNGTEVGGHLKDGCIIHTTAEIVIGELDDIQFTRKPDTTTGFNELVITKK